MRCPNIPGRTPRIRGNIAPMGRTPPHREQTDGDQPADAFHDAPVAQPAAAGFTRRAMVVEDDGFARTLLSETVAAHGFETWECSSAREAMRAFAAFDPDVLIVDIQLDRPPNGVQLAQALRERAPHLGIVVVSQYPGPDSPNITSSLPPGSAFVHKGRIRSAEVLLDAIESVLDDRAAPARVRAQAGDHPLVGCSRSQIALLRMIALGYSNERIAKERGTTLRAVEQLAHRTYAQLGVGADADGNARVRAALAYVAAFGLPSDGR